MKSTQLKYLFLFCRQDVSIDSPSNHFIVLLQIVCPTWYISQHSFISNNLVVLAGDTFFKGTFIAMCEVLHLNYDSKRNYKGLTVENYFRFLNKSVTIAAEERDTNNSFVPVGIAVSYTWKSAPIDSTDILRSIPAIGQELHFTLNISLNALPKLTQNNGQAALNYLRLTDFSRHLSTSILKILIEDHRTAHIERINNNRNFII